tara:strand:- start:130 stop:381 length:252 start_codon:yes stop_codon:yes gene_type:complete
MTTEEMLQEIDQLKDKVKDLEQVNKHLADTADGFFYRLLEVDPSYAPDSVPLDVQGGTPLHNPDRLQCEICETGFDPEEDEDA